MSKESQIYRIKFPNITLERRLELFATVSNSVFMELPHYSNCNELVFLHDEALPIEEHLNTLGIEEDYVLDNITQLL